MALLPPRRRVPALLGAATLGASLLVVSTAGPAAAAPAEGTVGARSHAEYSSLCTVENGADDQTRTYQSGQGERRAEATGVFDGRTTGQNPVRGVYGTSNSSTTVFATARNRAFKQVALEVAQTVAMNNDSGASCGMIIHASSEADGELRVREAGRVRIRWTTSGSGDLRNVTLTSASGVDLVNSDPETAEGRITVRVRPGLYDFSADMRTSISEASAPTGSTTTSYGLYDVEVTYLPPRT